MQCSDAISDDAIPGDSVYTDNSIRIQGIAVREIQNPLIGNQILPKGFVYLAAVCPSISQDIKYATADNFTGHIVPGYNKALAIITEEAAKRLALVQEQVVKDGFSLEVLDAYRPVTAVKAFKTWSLQPENGATQERFYPNLEKTDLFNGYISDKSRHSRGSAVDLTLVDLKTGQKVDMGTPFDFLDETSHTEYPGTDSEILERRLYLKAAMEAHGFENYRREWWHYQLPDDIEPFPRYPADHQDFPVE